MHYQVQAPTSLYLHLYHGYAEKINETLNSKLDAPSTTGQAGDFLTLTDSGTSWTSLNLSLTALSDTTISNTANTNILIYENSSWTNKNLDTVLESSEIIQDSQIQYTDTTNAAITLTKGIYYRKTNNSTSLTLNINENSNNSALLFTASSTFSYTINLTGDFKIHKAFAFEANKSYLVAVDNFTILWTEVQNYTTE